MIVMQYTMTFPADYDMTIIRDRVVSKGFAFDEFPGLGLETFMIRERGRCGAKSDQYAPWYIWPAVEPMWEFIAGDGFGGILNAFGWTPINYWLGLAYARREESDFAASRCISGEEQRITPGSDLKSLRRREIEQARERVRATPGLLACVVGVNVHSGSLVRFDYWAREQNTLPEDTTSFQVLHVSQPHAGQLHQT